ncbi:MAG: hypothetical protein IJR91_07130 [Ruminococcus sp.]|nr:hypothetical protein [Ruminococcus sp.]
MARFRKAAALIACAVMASTVSGCADTSYSVKYGDDTVKAGVYIGYLQTELNNQLYILSYKGIESKDYFSQQVEGVDLAEYVKNNALKDTKEYVAITKQFAAEGLTLTDDELKAISSNVKSSWDNMGGMYENNGVSKESLKEIYREQLMRTKLFDHYYGEGGSEAPTDEELQKYVNDNFIRYKMIALYKSSDSDESTANAENEEKLKKRDEYFEKGKDMNFDNFDELIAEYKAESESAADTDSSAAETDTSSEAGDDTSSTADTSSESESTADESSEAESVSTPEGPNTEDEAAEEPESDASSSEAESSSAVDSWSAADSSVSEADSSSEAGTDDSSEAEEEEPDPYANEAMIDLAKYTDEDYDTASGKLFKAVKEAEVGKVFTFENDNAYYIVVKGDVTQRTDYVSENRSTLVQSLKNDAFQSKLDSWVEAANITVNDKAIKRYTPQVIYDRMTEYSEKNSK